VMLSEVSLDMTKCLFRGAKCLLALCTQLIFVKSEDEYIR
jgi:hypothetical protein